MDDGFSVFVGSEGCAACIVTPGVVCSLTVCYHKQHTASCHHGIFETICLFLFEAQMAGPISC